MDQEAALTIERWSNVYRVPVDHPDPEELRSRLDRLVSAHVVDACRRRLAPAVQASDPSVWLIRRIDVGLILDAGAFAADRASDGWGEQLAQEILRTLEVGPSGDAVLRFRDRAAFVAQWARDAAAGRASGKWYYADFDSLGSLPLSAATAEAILRSGGAEDILVRLHELNALEPVLAALTGRDAQRLCDGVFPVGTGGAAPVRWIARLLALWNGCVRTGDDRDARDALRLFVAARTEWPGEDAAQFREAWDGLIDLRRSLALLGSRDGALAFLQALIERDLERARALTPDPFLGVPVLTEFVHGAAGGDANWAQFALSVLASPAGPGKESSDGPGVLNDRSFLSELGGILLLATPFADLGIGEALRAAAGKCEEPLRTEPLLRFLLAMRCMGRDRAALCAGDPAIALFAKLQRAPSLQEMAEAQAQADVEAALRIVMERWTERSGEVPNLLPAEHEDYFSIGRVFPELELDEDRERMWAGIAAALLRNFARRLPGFAKSSPEYLFRNFLAGTSQVRIAVGRIEVRLPQSPLAVVLRIAGAYRTVTLPWREGVEICLLAPAG